MRDALLLDLGEHPGVDAAEALTRSGGVATARQLLRHTTARRIRTAVSRGEIVRVASGRYALPGADEALTKALRVKGALALRSAALQHGWP